MAYMASVIFLLCPLMSKFQCHALVTRQKLQVLSEEESTIRVQWKPPFLARGSSSYNTFCWGVSFTLHNWVKPWIPAEDFRQNKTSIVFDSHPAKVSCFRNSMEGQDPKNLSSRGLTWGTWKWEWVILVDVYFLIQLMSFFFVRSSNFCTWADFLVSKTQTFWSDFFTELGLVDFGAQFFVVISLSALPLWTFICYLWMYQISQYGW